MKADRRVAILDTIFINKDAAHPTMGGAERYLIHLCRLLEELGYEPGIWQPGETTITYEGVKIQGLPWGEVEYAGLPELNRQFYERTAGYDKTIYMTPVLAFPLLRPRSVVISHSLYWDYPNHPGASLPGPLRQEWLRRLEYAMTAPDLFVAVDTNLLNWLRATRPGHETRQVYIPNFVDTEIFFPGEDGVRDKVIVLFPRRLEPNRGIDEARIAARILTAAFDRVEFHFVGQGANEAAEAEMRNFAAANPRCRYYWVPMAEMPDVYRQADIVIIPTKSCEGTSLACLEAMACGKAVVCGRVGGLTDLVIDQYNGRLIDVTPSTLTAAIRELVLHPTKRRRFGEAALASAQAFSLTNWKTKWAAALEMVW